MTALQAIEAELGRAREALLDAAARVSDEMMQVKPSPEEWSVAEILHHLEIVENRIADRLAAGFEQARQAGWAPDVDDPNVIYSIDQFQVQRVVTPIKTRNTPEPGRSRAELLDGLQHSREKLLTAIRGGTDVSWSKIVAPHPALGEFNVYQWLMFVARHEDRHRAQLERVHAAVLST